MPPLSKKEQAELAALESETSQGGLSAAEAAELSQLESEVPARPPKAPKAKHGKYVQAALDVGDAAGRALDFWPGLARTGAAEAGDAAHRLFTALGEGSRLDEANAPDLSPGERMTANVRRQTADATPPKRLLTGQDWSNAFEGRAPHVDELLQRIGIKPKSLSDAYPERFSKTGDIFKFKRGGPMDLTDTGTVGLGVEAALDPLTYLTAGSRSWTKPIAAMGEAAAYPIYRRGLKYADKAQYTINPRFRGAPASRKLFDRGVSGTASEIEGQLAGLLGDIGDERDMLLEPARRAGMSADPLDFLEPAMKHSQQLQMPKRAPAMQDAGKKLDDELAVLAERGPHNVDETAQVASDYGKLAQAADPQMPGNPYGVSTKPSPKKKGYENIRSGARNAVVDMVDAAPVDGMMGPPAPGRGAQYRAKNREFQSLLNAERALSTGAATELGKYGVTSVDGLLASMGILTHQNPATMLTAGGLKKLADLQKTTRFNTKAGMLLKNLGDSNVWDAVGRRWMSNNLKEE